MRIFGFEIRRASMGRGGWYPVVREPFTGAWQRNMEWRLDTVMAHPTVYACVTLIAGDIAKLRPRLVELRGDVWREVEGQSPFAAVLRRPNHFQTHLQFKENWIISKLFYGNTYVLLERDAARRIRAMYVLDPNRVRPLVTPDGRVIYQLSADNLAGIEESPGVPAEDIIHDRMPTLFHPLTGIPPLFAAGGPAAMGLEIQGSSRDFFQHGATPSGILTSPEVIPPEKAKEMAERWNARFGPNGPGGVAVLGFGMNYQPMRMTSVDAQLVEHLKWSDEAICRAFRVPGFKVGVGQMPTYQNGELLNQRYYDDCLQRHIEGWEELMDQAFGFSTLTEGRQLGVELDLDGLLRMDSATQMDTLVKGTRGSVLTPNEARQKIDLPPLEGGDTIYLQHQDYPMEQVFNRTDLEAPAEPAATEPEPPAEAEPDPARQALAMAIRFRTRRARLANV